MKLGGEGRRRNDFNPHAYYALAEHSKPRSCSARQVDDPTLYEWPAVIDANNDRRAGVQPRHPDMGAKRQIAVGGRERL